MGAIDTSYTFTATDVITSTKMNNILDQSTITSSAIFNNTLAVSTGGQLLVKAGGITSNELATGSVTQTKITDGSVTPAKLSVGGPTWDGGTTFMNSNLELGPNIAGDAPSYIDMHSSSGTDFNARIIRESGINNEFRIEQAGTSPIKLQASGGVKFADAVMSNPSGTAPIFGVRAWVNFNGAVSADLAFNYSRTGTTVTVTASAHGLIVGNVVYLDFLTGGALDGKYAVTEVVDANSFKITTVASTTIVSGTGSILRRQIRGAGNVSSVTYLNTSGDYFVNFAIPMPDENYAMSGFSNFPSSTAAVGLVSATSGQSVSQQGCDITVVNSGNGDGVSTVNVSVMFIR